MSLFRKAMMPLLAFSFIVVSCSAGAKNPYEKFYKDLPFEMVRLKAPVFPRYSVKLTDFGGVGDGVTMNTEAFSKAFEALEKKGGGKLIVPAGVWYTGPIVMKSNINLHL